MKIEHGLLYGMECKIIGYNKGNHTIIYYNIIQTNMEPNKRKII